MIVGRITQLSHKTRKKMGVDINLKGEIDLHLGRKYNWYKDGELINPDELEASARKHLFSLSMSCPNPVTAFDPIEDRVEALCDKLIKAGEVRMYHLLLEAGAVEDVG